MKKILTIPVYNIKDYLNDKFDCNSVGQYNNGMAIHQGKEIIMFDEEGCGLKFDEPTEDFNMTVFIESESIDPETKFKTYHTESKRINITIGELIEKCEVIYKPLDEFMIYKDYNNRCKLNYKDIVKLIKNN